jgi:phosphoenolpyruvate carboxylase
VRRRGRICIQTGFSDAGRYMGQSAAAVAIEKIRLGMARVLAEHGLADLELTIFDTHGESIGRGAHPGSFADRLRYYDTPESRRRFAAAGIELREETSFQGGDGYLYFLAPESALAVTTRILEHCLGPVGEADDPFYVQQDYVDEFFAAVQQFNREVIDNPAYASFLGAYGVNMLYPTGSRALRRQYDGGGARPSLEHPSQLRAIPHNSILQQLGILANTIGGVGEAVAKDPDRFHQLYRESPRFRRLMTMVEHAFKFTDLEVVKAYVDLFDPEPWLRRATAAKRQAEQEELRSVADFLERIDLHDRLARIHRVFHRDYMDLARALRDHRRMTRDAGEQPIAVDPLTRDNLHMLHALRLALIQRLMMLSVRVPDFSDRHATTHDTLVFRLMHLEVEPALELLAQIFPVTEEDQPDLDFGEPASYRSNGGQSYLTEHRTIFRPIARDYELIRRISSGIIYHVGAVG